MNITSLRALSGEMLFRQLSQQLRYCNAKITQTQVVYLETSGVPGKGLGERITVAQLAYGVLESSAAREAKGLPGTGLQPFLYHWYMTYVVM